MRATRLPWLAAATILLAGGLNGCDDSAGPLELQGHGGLVADPVDSGVWFRAQGCLAGDADPVDVMVTSVTTSPSSDHVATKVAWYDDSPVVVGKHGQPPSAYAEVTSAAHSGGTLDGCSLDVAVVLSPGTAPVVVRTVTVNYEVDGEAHTTRTSLNATLCPTGTRASSGARDGCRDARGSSRSRRNILGIATETSARGHLSSDGG